MLMDVQRHAAMDACTSRLSITVSTRFSYDGRQRIVLTSGAASRCRVQDTIWR